MYHDIKKGYILGTFGKRHEVQTESAVDAWVSKVNCIFAENEYTQEWRTLTPDSQETNQHRESAAWIEPIFTLAIPELDAKLSSRFQTPMTDHHLSQSATHRRLAERLAATRRELRDQEQQLAQLKYEWSIAKRLRSQARSEDEREKWRIQSDVYLGLVLQQEGVIEELQEEIAQQKKRMSELEDPSNSEAQP